MGLRRALEDSWVPTQSFTFDGSTSDLALQLYSRFKAGDSLDKLSLSSIPDTITSRLSDVNVAFDDLDGFAQRAVLWDSGFALTPTNDIMQIWTLDGRSMAELALTLDEFEATTCTAYNCTQPDGTKAHNNHLCTGTQFLTGAKCVVEEFDMANLNLAAWSIGGESTTIPEIELSKHSWTGGGESYKVYAVHTVNTNSERKYGDCPSTETYGYLNFPCYGSDDVPSSKRAVPTPSDWVTSWMGSYAAGASGSGSTSSNSTPASGTNSRTADSSSSKAPAEGNAGRNVALLGGAVGGSIGLLLVAVLVGLFVFTRRKKPDNANDGGSPMVAFNQMTSPTGRHFDNHAPKVSTQQSSDYEDPFQQSGATMRASEDVWSNPSTERGQSHYGGSRRSVPLVTLPPCYESDYRNQEQGIRASPSQVQGNYHPPAPGPTPNEAKGRSIGSEAAGVATAAATAPRRSKARPSKPMTAPSDVERIAGMGAHNALQVLARDPTVERSRIQLNQLHVERQLPMTTLQTDSCVGSYDRQHVMIKRLAPSSSVNIAAVESLAFEIQNRAHTGHKNLVQFVGAGWTSANDLSMVVEFHPQGTLRAFLDRNAAELSTWTPQKTKIAGGIARALAYLHKQTPAFIHHELCAKNVLLTDELEAKVASCGSTETNPSIGAKQKSRLAYWMAPEVLDGGAYSPPPTFTRSACCSVSWTRARRPTLTLCRPTGFTWSRQRS